VRTPWLCRAALIGILASAPLGCAFFNKSDPVVLRYFTPETLASAPSSPGVALAMRPGGPELRMGSVNAASYVKDRIAFRDKNFEVGYYEELRWTEKPEAYLKRALRRALFEEQGVRQIVSGPGTTLDVDLDAFEELRSPRHAARMQVTWILHDDSQVLVQETFTVERAIPSSAPSGPDGIAAAMAGAFDESVKRVVSKVTATLARMPIASPASAPSQPIAPSPPNRPTAGR
jgi:cholesterol transport system auxiliary component